MGDGKKRKRLQKHSLDLNMLAQSGKAKLKKKEKKKQKSDDSEVDKLFLGQIAKPYMYTTAYIDDQVNALIRYIDVALSKPENILSMLGADINVKLSKDASVIKLPIVVYLYNLILWSPLIDLNIKIDKKHIFRPAKLTDSEIIKYININLISAHRDATDFYTFCELLEFVKIQFNKIARGLGTRLMLSISLKDFISLMKESEESREILMTRFPIPRNATPDIVEKIAQAKLASLERNIIYRTDLNISNYVSAGLFNRNQLKEFAVHITYKPNFLGETIPMTSHTSMLNGLKDIVAAAVDGYGGRKAEVLKDKVKDAGLLQKLIAITMSGLHHIDLDYICNSPKHKRKTVDSLEDLLGIEGRYYTTTEHGNQYRTIRRGDTHLIGKTIYMKSPITCMHPKRSEGHLCRGCYTELLAVINQDRHIGIVTAYHISNEFQQILLSAKHSNTTNTKEVVMSPDFKNFFVLDYDKICFNESFLKLFLEPSPFPTADENTYEDYELVFNVYGVHKTKTGEGGKNDRCVKEIVIRHTIDDQVYLITEMSDEFIFLSPYLSNLYKVQAETTLEDEVIIPFSDLLPLITENENSALFNVTFKNNELAASLNKLQKILTTKRISSYESYDELIDEMLPLFKQGGIKTMDIHVEMVISQLIFDKSSDNKEINWYDVDAEYTFKRIESAVMGSNSALTSLIFRNVPDQLGGKFGTYDKRGRSIFDAFLTEK